MRTKTLLLTAVLALAGLLTGLTGCTTMATGERKLDPEKIAPAVKTAAFVGSFLAIEEHPEWRPGFIAAADELRILEKAEVIDFSVILAIVMRLPVKELKSDEARLAITSATILLTGYQDRLVELDKLENVRPIAKALREGIDLALD